MFAKCRPMSLAAITYAPLFRTDLSRYGLEQKPPGWEKLASSQKGSISKFAWEIRAGDSLYVRDSSRPHQLVGFGRVLGKEGELAYFYNERSPVKTKEGDVWRHLIRVDWEHPFTAIPYKDHSANTTVLRLDENELSEFRERAKRIEYKNHGLSDGEVHLASGLETAYPRATPATIRMMLPRHVSAFQRKSPGKMAAGSIIPFRVIVNVARSTCNSRSGM